MAHFIKLLLCSYLSDSRSQREVAVIKELGHKVTVFEHGYSNEIKVNDGIEFITRKGSFKGSPLRRLPSFLKWAYLLRKQNVDCISCYDLSALTIAWISTFFQKASNRPKLIYDAHEFELGRNAGYRRNFLISFLIYSFERFLIKRVEFSIMVNDTIADEIQKTYKLVTRPIVVRSVAPYTRIDKTICQKYREDLISRIRSQESQTLLMYHGAVTTGRGIEHLIEVISKLEGTSLIILGNGATDYIDHLTDLCRKFKVEDKVLFHAAVLVTDLWKYVGAVDIGMINIDNICLSYYFSLPNKLFENIQAETPIIGSNFPEISKIINQYQIGLTCDPESIDNLESCINEMIKNKVLYAKFKENIQLAKKELCWENEKKILITAYSKILN